MLVILTSRNFVEHEMRMPWRLGRHVIEARAVPSLAFDPDLRHATLMQHRFGTGARVPCNAPLALDEFTVSTVMRCHCRCRTTSLASAWMSPSHECKSRIRGRGEADQKRHAEIFMLT